MGNDDEYGRRRQHVRSFHMGSERRAKGEGEFRYEDTENLLKNISTRTPKLNSLLRWSSFEMIGRRQLAVPNIFLEKTTNICCNLRGYFLFHVVTMKNKGFRYHVSDCFCKVLSESNLFAPCVCSDVEYRAGVAEVALDYLPTPEYESLRKLL